MAGDALDDIQHRKAGPVDAIPTPIPDWNQLCGEKGGRKGVAKKWLIVIGGMPGSRKSYLALNCAAHAVEQGRRVGAINFEMSFDGYATRFLSVLSGIPKNEIGWGPEFDESSWIEAKQIADDVFKETGGALITNDAAVFTLGHIHEAYKAFAAQDVEMVVVDYVQLVRANPGSDLKERAGAIAESLRELSHKHNVATLALSQINREGMKGDKPPRMSDLYGGMYWEANANQVVMLNHAYVEELEDATRTELIIDKNRHDKALIEIPILWNHNTMRVEQDISYQQGVEKIIDDAPEYFNDGDAENEETEEDEFMEDVFGGAAA